MFVRGNPAAATERVAEYKGCVICNLLGKRAEERF